jgi:hypothetical protein
MLIWRALHNDYASSTMFHQKSAPMSRTIYALLIGIDEYPEPRWNLRGCVNDIDKFAAYLEERVAKDKGVALNMKTLKHADARR